MKRSFNVNYRLLCRKKVCLERLGPKSQPFSDENITIIYIIVVILVMSEANKRITVLFGTKRKIQYHAGYHEEQAKRYT